MKLRNKILSILALAIASTTISGCAYRVDLKQGNFVEQSAIDQLRQGMSQEQVQYILGTPMLTDALDNTRWYYVHFDRYAWTKPNIHNLILVFEGRVLKDIEGDFEKPASFYNGNESIQKIDFADMEQIATTYPTINQTVVQDGTPSDATYDPQDIPAQEPN